MSYDTIYVTPSLVKAARTLLGWSQKALAEESKVSQKTIADFERNARKPNNRTIHDLCEALRKNGIGFEQHTGELGTSIHLNDLTGEIFYPYKPEKTEG